MRGTAILLCVLISASQTAAVGLGFTVSPRLLFPLYYPYQSDMLWHPDQGVMAGFGVSLDVSLFPGFTAGPYFGGLFPMDIYPLQWSPEDWRVFWTDLVIGARFKYSIPTGGSLQPWLSVAPGYGVLSAKDIIDNYGDGFTIDYYNTGGFGLDAGIGVDYRISEMFFIGFGADFHLNTADKLEYTIKAIKRMYEINGDTLVWELEESPMGFGFGFHAGINL